MLKPPLWNKDENETLYGLTGAGLDDPEIALRMGKTVGAIKQRRARLGIPRPVQRGSVWLQAMDARITELWEDGMATAHIASAMSEEFPRPFSKNSIIGRAHRLGLKSRKIACLGERKPRKRTKHSKKHLEPKFIPVPLPPAENHVWGLFGELGYRVCRFIQGEPVGLETLMCGLPVSEGSYCQYHHWITHTKPPRASRAVALEVASPQRPPSGEAASLAS